MDIPRIYVDFNEMISFDLVLLSKENYKQDSVGNLVHLYEGLEVSIYMDDEDDNRDSDSLVASGIVVKNKIKSGWGAIAKWCCQIDSDGIYHLSDKKYTL